MANKTMWSNITENATARRQVSINVPEMDENEASLIYAETSYEAGVAAFAALDIRESIREFGAMADEKGFTAAEYIAEAFSFGGFFKKIFDFLVKMWNTIVNYVKALIGNKFGASGNIQKNITKAIQGLVLIVAKEFKADTEIKVKNYKIGDAARFGSHFVNPDLYLKTALLPADKVTSTAWGAGKSSFNIVEITKAAESFANIVTARKLDVSGEKSQHTADGAKGKVDTMKAATADVEAFTSKIGLGEKGAVQSFLLLLEEAKPAGVAKVIEDAKIKEAKSLTEFLRKVLGHFFPTDAGTINLKGDNIKAQASILASYIMVFGDVTMRTLGQTNDASGKAKGGEEIGAAVEGAAKAAKEGDIDTAISFGRAGAEKLGELVKKLQNTNTFNAIVDPIKESLKICEDVLAQLRKAAETIKSVSASDVKIGSTGEDGKFAEDKDQKGAEDYAGQMTAFGDKLLVLESAMQQVITKGMDAGSVILETASREILSQVEVMLKAASEKRTKADANNM